MPVSVERCDGGPFGQNAHTRSPHRRTYTAEPVDCLIPMEERGGGAFLLADIQQAVLLGHKRRTQ